MKEQRWAALGTNGEILQIGLTMFGRFERQCLPFSCGGYMKWVAEGSRYTELFIDSFVGMVEGIRFKHGQLNIRDYSHGRVRKCKSARQILS